MADFVKTDGSNADFHMLVEQLDHYLLGINGESNTFFAAYNTLQEIRNVIVVYEDGIPVACGAFKKFDPVSVEIKRMFVLPEYRNKGIAALVLKGLEQWAKELGYSAAVLETARSMEPAVKLYQKCGYQVIPNYGQYKDVTTSVCLRKEWVAVPDTSF